MFTLKDFFEVVAFVNWPENARTGDTRVIKSELLKGLLNTEEKINRCSKIYRVYSDLLYKRFDKYDRYRREVEGKSGFGLGDDGFGDNISEVISKGQEFIRLAYKDPEIGLAMAWGSQKLRAKLEEKYPELKNYKNWAGYTEKFSYCLPYGEDLKNIKPKTYAERIEKYLKDQEVDYFGNGETEHEPGFSTKLAENKIVELQNEIKEIESMLPDIQMIVEICEMVVAGKNKEAFDYLKANEDKVRTAYKKLHSHDLVHYGIANTLSDMGRFLYGEKIKLY